MFEEIPSPKPPPSQRTAVAFFGLNSAAFGVGMAIAWFRWSGPLSLVRKISVAEFMMCGVLSGVFLLAAKSAAPETNRKRIAIVYFLFIAFQLTASLLR